MTSNTTLQIFFITYLSYLASLVPTSRLATFSSALTTITNTTANTTTTATNTSATSTATDKDCAYDHGNDNDHVFGITKVGKVFHWKFHQTHLAPKIKILDLLVSIRFDKIS